MAAKVTEEECNLTPADELIRIGQCRFTVSDLRRMEKIVAEKLNFKCKAVTALTFLHLYHQITLSHAMARWGHVEIVVISFGNCKKGKIKKVNLCYILQKTYKIDLNV